MGVCLLAMAGALALPAMTQQRPALQDRNVVEENDGRSPAEIKRLYDEAFAAMLTDPRDLDKSSSFAGLAVRVGDLEGAVVALEHPSFGLVNR